MENHLTNRTKLPKPGPIYLLNTHSVQHTETDNEHIKHIKQ